MSTPQVTEIDEKAFGGICFLINPDLPDQRAASQTCRESFAVHRTAAVEAHAAHIKAFLEELAEYLGIEGTAKPPEFLKTANDIREKMAEQQSQLAAKTKEADAFYAEKVAAQNHLNELDLKVEGLSIADDVGTVCESLAAKTAEVDRLRAALQELVRQHEEEHGMGDIDVARAALAAEGTQQPNKFMSDPTTPEAGQASIPAESAAAPAVQLAPSHSTAESKGAMLPTEEQQKEAVDVQVIETKKLRVGLDAQLQILKALPSSRERSLSITKIQEAIMWLGMDLKRLNDTRPYPSSYDPTNSKVEPTADGLKL